VTAPATDFDAAEPFEALPGGGATSRKAVNRDAFSNMAANLTFADEETFKLGNAFFKRVWVSSPSSTFAADGLGPLYNARSCQRCHLKDGRGHPPAGPDDTAISMFLRLSIPPQTDADRAAMADRTVQTIPEPTYGGQLQNFAVPGIPAEGRMAIDYVEEPVALAGNEAASLRRPTYSFADPAYGPPHPQMLLSPRVAPPMIGLGLIEAIHPDDILALADPEDRNRDGISGKAALARDESGKLVLGRFGWKASMPSIRLQSAHAFAGDIGISSPEMPAPWGDCTVRQTACRTAPNGVQESLGDTEAPPPVLDLVTFYAQHLAVPGRRDVDDPQVLAGKKLFYETGCTGCHTPKFVTSRNEPSRGTGFQLIWPYSDLLLHDMGAGLADNRPDGDATGQEWRTPPLWGIGLTETVNGHTFFLHDGRARNLLEAILWHGGEAQAARDRVVALSPSERAALIRFLESL
jgi:CxxC motif-containing protein (DUF1111 family)